MREGEGEKEGRRGRDESEGEREGGEGETETCARSVVHPWSDATRDSNSRLLVFNPWLPIPLPVNSCKFR